MTLVLLVAAWLAGLLLGLRVAIDPLPVFLLLLATLPLGWLLRVGGHSIWPAALVGLLLLALFRVEATGGPSAPLVTQDDHQVTLRGRVVSDPEAAAQSIKFVLAVEAINRGDDWQELHSKALAYADPPASLVSMRDPPYFRYGDTLLLQGMLKHPKPFGGFDYPSYLANQGIHGVIWSRQTDFVSQESGRRWRGWIFDLRHKLSESIEDALPVSQSSLAQALLLGLRARIPQEVQEDFRNTGTSHLLAISGLNVSMVLVMAIGAAAWLLGKRRQVYLLLPLVAIWAYALLSGLAAPVERAAIMSSIYLAALALGRPQSVLPALAFGAAVMATINPHVLAQVDFQLSFAAVAGIALAVPYQARIAEAITGRPALAGAWWRPWLRYLVSWVAIAMIVSAAATLATLPLVAFNFHRIPLFGILVTVLSLPAQPAILLGSLITALAGLIHPMLGQFFGWLTWVPLSYQLGLVSLPLGITVSGSWIGSPIVWGWYIVLGGLLLLPGGLDYLRKLLGRLVMLVQPPPARGLISARPSGPALALLGLALILVVAGIFWWLQVFNRPDGKLHVYFFDVGQGDSVLIVTPAGRQVLVDGGPGAESATRALAGPLPFWDRSLDLVVLTHLDADHSRGLLEVLDRYQVSATRGHPGVGRLSGVLVGEEDRESALYAQWRDMLDRRKLKVIPVWAGYQVILEKGVTLEVLNPPPTPFRGSSADQNNNGVVLRLAYGYASFLLTADIQSEAERYLASVTPTLESVVLKVPHHGSKTSTTAEFLQRAKPSWAVISAGAGNRLGHPHPEVMARLEQMLGVAKIYQTSQRGTIEFISDGRQLWVETQR